MHAVLYARTSTELQDNGIDAQREALLAEADRRGWTPHVITEQASGKTMARRPQLGIALTRLAKLRGDGVLVVTKLDRLARSVRDVLTIVDRAKREGWGLVVLNMPGMPDGRLDTTDAGGMLMLTVFAAFAEFERTLISQRTREALAVVGRTKQLGKPSKVPTDVRARIASMRDDGMSWRAVSDGLNRDDVPGPAGGAWYPASAQRVYELDHPKEAVS
jgi:DNA invertase Pin-like site-specific DNA recombinase